MIEPILTTLQILSNSKSVLDLVSTVSRYVRGRSTGEGSGELRRGVISYGEKQQALEATLREWEHVAALIEPAIGMEFKKYAATSLSDRAEALAKLAREYSSAKLSSPTQELDEILLRHTAVVRWPDGTLQLRLGQSDQTRSLRGEAIDILKGGISHTLRQPFNTHGGKMDLPVFKVTMLGQSGSGKTVFMSSMYAKLREGENDIAIRAIKNDVDLELDRTMASIYEFSTWPPGNEGKPKNYDFVLLLRGKPIAQIDWVDYRGGVVKESDSKDEGAEFIKRLQESHSIIWMVDMSRLGNKPFNTMAARLLTGVPRMAQLCRQALAGKHDLRSILFVRTKSDEVRGDSGEPDFDAACRQLLLHLGPENFKDIPSAAAVPVSSVGRISAEKVVMGEDPTNVEWPLILALAFILKIDLLKLDQATHAAHEALMEAKPHWSLQFLKDAVGWGMNEQETHATEELDQVARRLIGMREIIGELLRHRPSSIRMFKED